jgi:hypothetical protein
MVGGPSGFLNPEGLLFCKPEAEFIGTRIKRIIPIKPLMGWINNPFKSVPSERYF